MVSFSFVVPIVNFYSSKSYESKLWSFARIREFSSAFISENATPSTCELAEKVSIEGFVYMFLF